MIYSIEKYRPRFNKISLNFTTCKREQNVLNFDIKFILNSWIMRSLATNNSVELLKGVHADITESKSQIKGLSKGAKISLQDDCKVS